MRYTITIYTESVSPKVLEKFTTEKFYGYLKERGDRYTLNDDGTIHTSYRGGNLLDYVLHVNISLTPSATNIVATVPELCTHLEDSDSATLRDKLASHLTTMKVGLVNGELHLCRECWIDGKDATIESLFSAVRSQCASPFIWPVLDLIGSAEPELKNGSVVQRCTMEIGD